MDFEFGGSQALQSGFLYKILNKPCSPEKLGKRHPECSLSKDGQRKRNNLLQMFFNVLEG